MIKVRINLRVPLGDNMTEKTNDIPESVIGALLSSGFPFQTAVAKVAHQAQACNIVAEEWPWRDNAGTDQFLDLVVTKGFFVLPIECKKTKKESLTFLQPGGADSDEIRARCLYLAQIRDSTKRMELYCGGWNFSPKSAESAFCVVSTSDTGKDQRLLERDVQRLIRGTDAYALHFKREFQVKEDPELDRFIIPVLVTNAKLFIAEYDPAAVSLDTGQFTMPPAAKISPVSWVRFRKAFTSGHIDLGHRTVFVVSANALTTFLNKLDHIRTIPSEGDSIQIPTLGSNESITFRYR